MRQGALKDFVTSHTKALNPYNHARLLITPVLANNYLKIIFFFNYTSHIKPPTTLSLPSRFHHCLV